MKHVLAGIFLLILSSISFSQTLRQSEDSLLILYQNVLKESADSLKIKGNNAIEMKMMKVLSSAESFRYPFSKLNKIGFIYSPDSMFRLVSWNFLLSDGNAVYHALIQKRPDKRTCDVIPLHHRTSLVVGTTERLKYNKENWYGALYYSILPKKMNDHTYYTLLGFMFNSLLTNQKVIEPLYFNESGNPIFGIPVFSINGKLYNRLVFEFNERLSMTLRYDDQKDLIIFDHLAPNDPMNSGIYESYGPDGTYDGLRYDGRLWHLESKITVSNPKPSDKRTKVIRGK